MEDEWRESRRVECGDREKHLRRTTYTDGTDGLTCLGLDHRLQTRDHNLLAIAVFDGGVVVIHKVPRNKHRAQTALPHPSISQNGHLVLNTSAWSGPYQLDEGLLHVESSLGRRLNVAQPQAFGHIRSLSCAHFTTGGKVHFVTNDELTD